MSDPLDLLPGRRIAVIGDLMLDHYVWGDAARLSPEAPVPVVHVQRDTFKAGGAANVALNLAALGIPCELCGWAGDDDSGRRLRAIVGEHGVDFAPGWTRPGLPTITKTRIIAQKQQVCRMDREDKPATYAAGESCWPLIAAAIDCAGAVICSDYAKGFLDTSLTTRIRDHARARGALVAFDPKPRHPVRVTGLDLLTPNRQEALQLAGIEAGIHEPFPAEEVCARIHAALAPRLLVITLGADGMLVSRGGRVEARIPTYAREIFDVSGAGDTAIAALTAFLLATGDPAAAAHWANLAAGVVVGKLGTATCTAAELRAAAAERCGQQLP